MKFFHSSITFKLLALVLPLVCIPIMVVGYFSYQSSIETVSRLARGEKMLRARVSAETINSVFKSCISDLEIISQFILEYYRFNVNELSAAPRKVILAFFEDLIARSPYYSEIRLTDAGGDNILKLLSGETETDWFAQKNIKSIRTSNEDVDTTIYISKIFKNDSKKGYFIDLSKPLKDSSGTTIGNAIITIDYNMIIDLIANIRFGEQGHAFMVDQAGRTIAHPVYEPYQYNFTRYKDARLRELIVNMIIGETGWKTFDLEGEKAAAYAPIEATRWSLAVSTSMEEFVRDARELRTGVIQTVLMALFLSALAVTFISHRLLKPIKQLASATESIAAGDWSEKIPVNSKDELGMLTCSFNRMMNSLKDTQQKLVASEKLISLGRLSAGVAHEFRNPLNAMKGAVEYMKRRRSEDALIREYGDILLEEINRLSSIVDEFLYFSKKSKPKPVLINLNDLIDNILNLFEEEFRSKKITVTKTLEPDLPSMMLDAHQMEQVLINLFINAIDAANKRGSLHVATHSKEAGQGSNTGKRILLIVKDNGAGIQPEDLKNIFDPFFSTKESGTGLGLPISYGIVEGHGGTIRVQSKPGRGTIVTVDLPFRDNSDKGDVS